MCFEAQEQGNWDLWLTRARKPTSGKDATLQHCQGLPVRVKTCHEKSKSIHVNRKKLCQYAVGMVVFVTLSSATYHKIGPRFSAEEPVGIKLEDLQANAFYFVPIDRPGEYNEVDPDSYSGRTDLFSLLFPTPFIHSTYWDRAKFESDFGVFRVATDEQSMYDAVPRHFKNAEGWYSKRTLPQTEHQLGASTHWVEQRGTKILVAMLTALGFTVDTCREGAQSDLIINGTIRVEIKSGRHANNMNFFANNQRRRPDPEEGDERHLDLVIQHYFNIPSK
jgi:hypothetical protein